MSSKYLKRWSPAMGLAVLLTLFFISPAAAVSDLYIESTPSGATIFINDANYGPTPATVDLAPGNYWLELKKQGYRIYGDRISIRPNRRHEIHALMAPARGYGKIVIASDPEGAALFINQEFRDMTPVELVLKPGRYNIRVEKKGYVPYIDEVYVREKRTQQITVPLTAEERYGALIIDSEPPGAHIYIRSRYYDVTPARIKLEKGDYRVRVEKEGYQPQIKTVLVGGDRKARVSFALDPIARHGVLRVTSDPARCKVFIDGKFYNKTPVGLRLPAGRHELKLTKKGYSSHVETLYIEGGEDMAREIVLAGRGAATRGSGTLRINSVPSGAQAKANGKRLGITPVEVDLPAGRYEILLEKPGHRFSMHQIEVRGGQLNVVWLHMRGLAPRQYLGELHLVSNPKAAVSIDGSDYGFTPLVVNLPAGKHSLELQKEGFRPYREDFPIAVGQVLQRNVDLRVKHSRRPVRMTGRIEVVSNPLGAKVFIDQKYIGRTPQTLDLDPGTYSFEIRQRGYIPYRQDVRIRPGKNSPLAARMRWQGHSRPAWDLKEVIEGIFREN